jgi:hypothetical protein
MSDMRALQAIALTAVLLGTRVAGAGVSADDEAKANALFEQGQKLIEANKVDLACDSFEASLAIDPQLGTKLNLADCRERQNRLAVAYRLFKDAGDEAARANKPAREKFARQHLDAIIAKVVRLTVKLAAPDTRGLAVKLGARELPRESWSTEQIAEPGKIVIDVTGPGRTPFHAELDGVGGGQLTVDVPELAVPAAVVVRTALPAAPVPHRSRAPWIVGGAGGALLLGSVAVGLHARSRYNAELDKALPDLNKRLDGPQREADIATVLAITGGIAVTVGIVLYIRHRHDDVVIAPTASASSVGVTLSGRL